jgi:hypothetical protein
MIASGLWRARAEGSGRFDPYEIGGTFASVGQVELTGEIGARAHRSIGS